MAAYIHTCIPTHKDSCMSANIHTLVYASIFHIYIYTHIYIHSFITIMSLSNMCIYANK